MRRADQYFWIFTVVANQYLMLAMLMFMLTAKPWFPLLLLFGALSMGGLAVMLKILSWRHRK